MRLVMPMDGMMRKLIRKEENQQIGIRQTNLNYDLPSRILSEKDLMILVPLQNIEPKSVLTNLKKIERKMTEVREKLGTQADLESGLLALEHAISSFEDYAAYADPNSDSAENDTYESKSSMKESVDSKSDKAVLEAFTDGSPLDGNKLSTDGITLNGHWMGGNRIAEWVPTKDGEKIKFNDLGSKIAQQVQKAIAKIAPSNWLLNGKGY